MVYGWLSLNQILLRHNMNQEFFQKLQQWQEAEKALDHYKKIEMELRKELFEIAFPMPTEGTLRVDLQEGWKLKGVYKITRSLDEAALPAVMEQIRAIGFNADKLVEFKPSLNLKEYKALPLEFTVPHTGEVVQPRRIFEQAMTSKPGAPSLELEAPKS